jgi:hypothetical protein
MLFAFPPPFFFFFFFFFFTACKAFIYSVTVRIERLICSDFNDRQLTGTCGCLLIVTRTADRRFAWLLIVTRTADRRFACLLIVTRTVDRNMWLFTDCYADSWQEHVAVYWLLRGQLTGTCACLLIVTRTADRYMCLFTDFYADNWQEHVPVYWLLRGQLTGAFVCAVIITEGCKGLLVQCVADSSGSSQ